ncbi:hypothetical protein AZF37_07870 [endosymbiont 'TC1' of Trimyema compressum]|uniref:BMP family ABC transporter substrate-binding protein n=1 Tax=endosymbiont 'TC1' of Trimyema compressum TaxID=243899 RepID=UPI0007F16FEE|nr:BMP family ABC transporter substrate-binding protein [endosymbiont 'TC1' of Trimyema compressum]AMP21089.1 hypothetical protein AZF37_07870 [endosymbiont 'TC1' of Trimyema compressum]
MKKNVILVLLCLLLAVVASSCSETKKENKVIPTTPKVGLLLMGSPSDKYSASYYGYRALKAVEEKYGIEITYNEYVTEANAPFLLSDYSKKGYSPVIVQGEALGEAVLSAGANYPDMKFVCIDGLVSKDNVSSYNILQEDLVEFAGAISAGLSIGNTVGYMELTGVESFKDSFEKGVKFIKTDGTLNYQEIDSVNKDYVNEISRFDRNNINSSGLYVNSIPLEDALKNINVKGVVIGGYLGDDPNRNGFVRLGIDYDTIYDLVYRDFLAAKPGQKSELGFKDNIFIIEDNGHIYGSLQSRLEELKKNLR